MNKIRRKLGSRRGASITFALLLFLVCAVVSAAVIAAGTTSAGRMSQLVEMDQRYYAVISAGDLLRDVFEQVDSVVVEYEETKGDGESATTRSNAKATLFYKDSTKQKEDEVSVGTQIYAILMEASKELIAPSNALPMTKEMVLQLASEASAMVDNAPLDCEIKETLSGDGLLTFEITNKPLDSAKEEQKRRLYKLRLVFASNVQAIAMDASNMQSQASDKSVKKDRVSWTLLSVEKQRFTKEATGG